LLRPTLGQLGFPRARNSMGRTGFDDVVIRTTENAITLS